MKKILVSFLVLISFLSCSSLNQKREVASVGGGITGDELCTKTVNLTNTPRTVEKFKELFNEVQITHCDDSYGEAITDMLEELLSNEQSFMHITQELNTTPAMLDFVLKHITPQISNQHLLDIQSESAECANDKMCAAINAEVGKYLKHN